MTHPNHAEGAPGPSPLGTGDRLFPVSLQGVTSERVKFFFAPKCPHPLIPDEIKNIPNSAYHFAEIATLVPRAGKWDLDIWRPGAKQLRAARVSEGMHHSAIQVCTQNSAKSAKIAPNSLRLTTFARQIHNHPGIRTLLKNMMFWD